MKEYKIFLDDVFIGTTNFEFADVPMGIIYGKVFFEIKNPYHFLKNFYLEKNADFEFDDATEFLDSMIQSFIKITDGNNELKGWGAFLSGIKDDFEITFGGIDGEFMKTEFPHHYNDYYKETNN